MRPCVSVPFLSIFICHVAVAAGPEGYGVQRAPEYGAAQGSVRGRIRILTDATRTYAVGEWNRPDIYPFHSIVVVKGQLNSATCAMTLTSSVTFAAGYNALGACRLGYTQGTGETGQSACFTLAEGERVDQVPKFSRLQKSGGGRIPGTCKTAGGVPQAITAFNGEPTHIVCRVAGDCTEAGAPASTICDTSVDEQDLARLAKSGGAFIVCRGSAATSAVHARIEE